MFFNFYMLTLEISNNYYNYFFFYIILGHKKSDSDFDTALKLLGVEYGIFGQT